ncbi:MAG: CapA family protein [Bacillota bacterium]|nr:CapA family protein [Bacillota bacterium]
MTQKPGLVKIHPMITRHFRHFFLFLLVAALAFPLFQVSATVVEEGEVITLTFTGDCTLGSADNLWERDYSFVYTVREKGFDYPFLHMRDFFSRDDLTIVNLENVFYDKTNNKSKKNYLFRAPTEFAKILSEGNVELAFLGNNHMLDYGRAGMESTMEALAAEGIHYFGSNDAHALTYIYEKNGIKIGFIGSVHSYFYRKKDVFAASLEELKQAGCQVIIGIVHDGTEYSHTRNKAQQSMANWLVKNGVNLVIGHHPHVVQGLDQKGSSTVVFSLGNFSFGGNHRLDILRRPGKRADKALIARVELSFDTSGQYLGHQVNLIPVSPSGVSEYNNYQPVFLQGEDALKTMQLVQSDTDFELEPFIEGVGAIQAFVPYEPPIEEPAESTE